MDEATKRFLNGLSGTRLDVAMSVIQTVKRAGGKVVAVGSWVSGNKYLDPLLGGTSDHDLRVVFEGSEELAIARYRTLRREIISQINQRFGPDAGKVLNSINLYPPEVLLEGIDDAGQALQKLEKLGINPNLGGAITEGLWGKGAKAFRDAYEAAAGRLIWKEGNVIRSGFADLLPAFGEKVGIYTIQGSGNTAKQFADKIDDALRAGDAKSVYKQLGRLRDSLKKGRDLGRFSQASYLDDLLNRLDDCCKDDLKKLATEINNPAFRESLSSGLQRARFEAEVLLRYAAETNPQNIQILREMLQGTQWSRFREAFLNYAGKVTEAGGKLRVDLALKGFFHVLAAYQVYDYYKKATQADLEGLLQNALLDATFLVSPSFVVGFVPLILKAILDDAIDYGYALITTQQDCQDLIAGIYEVKGRESLDVNQRAERSVQQLANEYTDQSKVEAVVALHARNATIRNGQEDPKAEKILYDRCSKEIVDRWRWRRIEQIAEAIDILKKIESDFNATNLIGKSTPEEVWILPEQTAKVDVGATLEGNTAAIQQKLAQFEKTIKPLGGTENLVGVSINQRYRWMPYNLTDEVLSSSDKPIFDAEKATRQFSFEGENIENLRLEYELEIKVNTVVDDVLSVGDELERTLAKTAPFIISVLKPAGTVEIIAPAEPKAGTPITLTAKLDETLKQLKDFQLVWLDVTEAGAPKTGSSYSITLAEGSAKNVRLEVYAKLNGVDTKVAQAEKTITLAKEDKGKVGDVAVSISPASATVLPTELVNFTVNVTGTQNTDVMVEATDYQGRSHPDFAGTITKTGPNAYSYKTHPYEGEFTVKATSRADYKKSATAKITTKLPAAEGIPYGVKITRLGCGKEFVDTCKNNQVTFPEFRTLSSPAYDMLITLDAPAGVNADNLKDLPLSLELEYVTNTRPEIDSQGVNSLNCPPRGAPKTESIKLFNYAPTISGNKLTVTWGFSLFMQSPQVKVWLTVYDDVARPPIYKWNYKKGDRFMLFSGSLPACGAGAQIVSKPTPTDTRPVKLPIAVTLSADKTKVNSGEQANITAKVAGGTAPFRFVWTGQHAGEGEAVTFVSSKAGTQPLSVKVIDAAGSEASASIAINVIGAEVILSQLESGGPITIGSTAKFEAKVMREGRPATGDFVYRWEPSTEVRFTPAEGPNQQSVAAFNKPGRAKVWVVVLERKGAIRSTIAESDRLELDIIAPKLQIALAPDKALIGTPVKAKLNTEPPNLKGVDVRWELPANAQLISESRDSREITFSAKDTNPIEVVARARVLFSGEDLGSASARFAAEQFDVKVAVLGAAGPKPQVWKPGVGLVTVENAIAVHQNVTLRADVTPQPPYVQFRYEWSVNEDSHIVGSGISNEVRMNRSQVGTCEATVVVRDQNGLELGRGTGAFDVSVSGELMSDGVRKKEAADKVTKAKEIVRKGQLDEAIALVDEAVTTDPTNAEASELAKRWKSDRAVILEKLERVKQLIAEVRFVDAQKELVVAQNINYSYPPVIETTKLLGDTQLKWDFAVREGIYQVSDANSRREFKRALELAEKLRATMKLGVYEDELKQQEVWAQRWESEKEAKRQLLKAGEAKLRAYDYEGALKDFEAGFMNFANLWAMNDPEPPYYNKLRGEALAKNKRINELMPYIKQTAEDSNARTDLIQAQIKNAEEVLALQPTNDDARRYREMLTARLTELSSKSSAAAFIKAGQDFYDKSKYQQAIAAFNQALEADPNSSATYAGRCLAKRAVNDNAGAQADCDRALALDPNNADAFRGLSMIKRGARDYQGALADANRSVALAPDNYRAYLTRGLAKDALEDFNGAIADYNRAIELNPAYGQSYLYRANARLKVKDNGGALTDFDRFIAGNQSSSAAYNNRGLAKERLGDKQGAITDYEKAIALNPSDETAKRNLVRIKAGEQTTATVIFDNGNIGGVGNSPSQPTVFTIYQPHFVSKIEDYHWNYGRGAPGGTIALRTVSGAIYGPWTVTTSSGQGGAPNVIWSCTPDVVIPAGTYTVVDSDPATWSQNSQSDGRGFSKVAGYPAAADQITQVKPQPTPQPTPRPTPQRTPESTPTPRPVGGEVVTAIFENRSGENAHIFVEGQTFSPSNRLAPGETRRVEVRVPANGRVKFYAGRNGQVLATRFWDGDPDHLDRYPRVVFSGSQLTITTGLR